MNEMNQWIRDFPGGPVVKTLPSHAWGRGSISGKGTKIPHATGQLSPPTATSKWPIATIEPTCSGADIPQLERCPHAVMQLRPDAAK